MKPNARRSASAGVVRTKRPHILSPAPLSAACQKAPKSHWPRSALPLSYTAISGNQRKSGRMGQFGMGQPVRRLEDHRLVTGHGRYTDDINLARQVYLHVVRSPHAHARVGRLDTAEAAASAGAKHVVALRLGNNRLVANSMETRNAIGDWDAGEQRYTLYASTQGSHPVRQMMAGVLSVPENRIRVVTPDVGGGFGMKLFLYREFVLVLYAARKLGRPVKWAPERSEAFLSDTQGRDNVTDAELALDGDGKFLAIRVATVANMGAYLSNFSSFIPTLAGTQMLTGLYNIPAAYVAVKCVFTHTVPIDAYRGAGRPEAAFVIERVVDVAARRLGIPATELRRRNFVKREEMPYNTSPGLPYYSGRFVPHMDDALPLADPAGFASRRADSRKT